MTSKNKSIRKEYDIIKERRDRHIKSLVEEAIVNVLAEQEAPPPPQQQQQIADPLPPAVATPGNQAQANEQEARNYSVDDLIEALNVIRGGRSFSDPEVYGKLVTFFKNTSEDQRMVLETLLAQIAELVTGVDELDNNAENGQSQNQTPASPPPPPGGAPQQTAPMPGAQSAAGAAGVGVA